MNKDIRGEYNTQIKYSIIIPAHNASKTIRRVINSIAQRLDYYEIIVVENGSTDSTIQVVEKLRQENERIILIQTDKGVSRARNAGIAAASGEWIIFVDADDEWIVAGESLNDLANNYSDVDLVVCSYYKDKNIVLHDFTKMNEVLKGKSLTDAFNWMLTKPTLRMPVWAKLYKREIISRNQIEFNEDLRLSEDAEFLIKLLKKCECIAVSSIPIYRYRTDAPSVVRSADSSRIEAYFTALDTISKNMLMETDASMDFVLAHLNLICVHDIYTRNNMYTWREKNKKTKEVICHPIVNKAVGNVGIGDMININRIPAFFFKHGMYTVGGIVCSFRSWQNGKMHNNH